MNRFFLVEMFKKGGAKNFILVNSSLRPIKIIHEQLKKDFPECEVIISRLSDMEITSLRGTLPEIIWN